MFILFAISFIFEGAV